MTNLTSLQQSQVGLLKSIFSLASVRTECIPLQNQQKEVDRLINDIEENIQHAMKVIYEMKKELDLIRADQSLLPLFSDILNPYL